MIPRLLTLVALALTPALAWGQQPLRHVHPDRDAEVPVSGWPTWIENLTVGSPVADHGSHAGLKAAVTTDAPMHAQSFLGAAHYSGFQTVAGQVDQSLVYVVEGGRARLAPPSDRQVVFHPWGWEETARGDGLLAHGAVTTLARNAFLITARIVNRGAVPRALAPRLALLADGDGVHEGMHPLHFSWIQRWRASLDAGRRAALVRYRRGTVFEAMAWDRQRFVRYVASDAALVGVKDGLEPYAPSPRRWSSTLVYAPRLVAPGAALQVAFVVACGADDAEAGRALDGARGALADPWGALARVRAAWQADLAALPRPHTTDPDELRLYDMAYTGMRMNRYAQRDGLSGTTNTAAKIHFNATFVWDAAIAALAESNWDPALGRELLTTLFRGQQPEGHLHYAIGPDGKPVNGLIRTTSQPPIHGWVAERVIERGGVDRAWLDELYRRSADYLAFFERRRDPDRDGSFGFVNALETGWDDTPRYPGIHPAPSITIFGQRLVLGNLTGLLPVKDVEALDLNAWLVSYHRAMAGMAEELGRPAAEAQGWRDRANALARTIDDTMWDATTGTYRDLRTTVSRKRSRLRVFEEPGRASATHEVRAEPVRVDTPVVAWPLFLGVARDPERVRRTVEGYLLDPTRAFGDPDDPARPFFPVPSVAYDDPAYDHATHGYYWRGQSWLVPAYAAIEALYKYGWEAEARELKRRVLRGVTKAHAGGIYETYEARTGRIGFGSGSLTGAGEPAAFLIGLSCAPVAELLLDRHERERFVGAQEAAFTGYVREARALETDAPLYRVRPEWRGLLPRTRLATRDGAPLRAPTQAGLELTLEAPHGDLVGPIEVTLPGKAAWTVWGVGPSGTQPLPAGTRGGDLIVNLARTDQGALRRYVLLPPGAPAP